MVASQNYRELARVAQSFTAGNIIRRENVVPSLLCGCAFIIRLSCKHRNAPKNNCMTKPHRRGLNLTVGTDSQAPAPHPIFNLFTEIHQVHLQSISLFFLFTCHSPWILDFTPQSSQEERDSTAMRFMDGTCKIYNVDWMDSDNSEDEDYLPQHDH